VRASASEYDDEISKQDSPTNEASLIESTFHVLIN
jgi:hypothetical protein